VNNNAVNAAASMQDGTWSAIALGPAVVLTPDPTLSLPHDEMNIYLEEMPEDACNTTLPWGLTPLPIW